MSKKTSHLAVCATTALLLVGGNVLAAEKDGFNRVADGDFETGLVSLNLPEVDRFPWVIGGWATRGRPVPRVVADPELAFEGERALRLTGGGHRPVHVLQDVPLTTAGYELQVAFYAEAGTQHVRLYSAWGREQPGSGQLAVAISLTQDGLEVTTPAGRWRYDQPISSNEWHSLRVISDPRKDLHSVALDGSMVLSLPSVSIAVPTTLLIGDSGDGAPSSYLYDAIRLAELFDIELAGLHEVAAAQLEPPLLRSISRRLESAATAKSNGAPGLALPELRAARRLLVEDLRASRASNEPGNTFSRLQIRRALNELISLLRES